MRMLLTASVLLALTAGAYAFPERGSRTAKPSDAPPSVDSSVPDTGQGEESRAASTRTENSPSAAPTPRANRTKAARNAPKERAPAVPDRSVEEPSPAPPEIPSPAVPTAPPAPQPVETTSAGAPEPVRTAPAATPELAADFPVMRALGGIGIVLTLIVGGFYATRRFAPQLFQKPPAEKALKVIETMQMGDKRSIAIVQVGEKRLLLGNTSSRITLLAVLENVPPPGESADVASQATPRRAHSAGASFRNMFEVEKRPAAPRSATPKTITPDIRAKMKQLRETLEQ